MARVLIFLIEGIVLFLLVRTVMRLLSGGRTAPRRSQTTDARTPERIGGTLVRDPECGTYIPESHALPLRTDDGTLYFCSAKCRDAHAGGRSARGESRVG
jgi:hypothetical protein